MARTMIIAAAWLVSAGALAQAVVTRFVDLRDAQALAQLQQSNPAHVEKIRKILEGLQEKPERAEGDWLQKTFAARDVDLSRFVIKTSYPPKQVLQFTLDDVHYTMHLVRRDMVPVAIPAR
jgi:hypothetical protein